MRCQVGDLALIIAGHDRSIGTMVTCVRLMRPGGPVTIGGFDMSLPATGAACWLVNPPVQWLVRYTDHNGQTIKRYVPAPYCADCCLMPVRPDPEYETDALREEIA